MSKVIYNMSASLDGFVRASGTTPEAPLGVGGERLHEWFGDPESESFVKEMLGSLGAVICGRTTYDTSLPSWGANGPTGGMRLPVVVLTHRPPATPVENGVYTFVVEGIEAAVRQAKALAGTKNVSLMGGPDAGGQALAAGLVDEVVASVVPTLLGSGLAMFSNLSKRIELEPLDVVRSRAATHLFYRVLK